MLPSRVPIRIVAADPCEYQAFADVLNGGQTGALVLAGEQELPLAALVCPSGNLAQAEGLPMLVLGQQSASGAGDDEVAVRRLPVPAALKDVLGTLEVLVRESAGSRQPRLFGGRALDVMRQILTTGTGESVALTDTETRLLSILFDAGGREMGRDVLLQRVWGYRPGLDTHTLETHIYRLRQKIETNPTSPTFLMTTESGYRLAGGDA